MVCASWVSFRLVGTLTQRNHDDPLQRSIYTSAWLVSLGVPLTEVRDLLGHSSIKMTERYAHLAPENVRAAVTLLEGNESRLSHVEEITNLQELGKSLK
jgi:hypothetical protein